MPSVRRITPVDDQFARPASRSREPSGDSEGQARGGGSRPVGASDSSALTVKLPCSSPRLIIWSAARPRCGSSAAAEPIWQAGVQQSIFAWSTGLAGILPSILQLCIPELGVAAAFAATGANASPSTQRKEISSRITRLRIGTKAYLSMNGPRTGVRGSFRLPWLMHSARTGGHRSRRPWFAFGVRPIGQADAGLDPDIVSRSRSG